MIVQIDSSHISVITHLLYFLYALGTHYYEAFDEHFLSSVYGIYKLWKRKESPPSPISISSVVRKLSGESIVYDKLVAVSAHQS